MDMHRSQVRHAQDLALRDSLAGSSFGALTLVVGTLLALQAFGPPAVRILDPGPGPVDPPVRVIDRYFPLPDALSDGPRAGTITEAALVLPVDDRDRDPIAEPAFAPTGPGPATGAGEEAGTRVGAPGGEGAAPVLPDPDEYVVHDEIPVVVRSVFPDYPPMAREGGLEGRVRVRAFVGVDGRVLRAEAEGEASLFDEAAVGAVRRWVFTPAKANGQPVAVWVRVPVVFRLH